MCQINLMFYSENSVIHVKSKAETSLVESWNYSLRYYIEALIRRTKYYFKLNQKKTIEMAMDLFFY